MADIRLGPWIQTYTGKVFYPLDPRPEDIDIRDIAHALALVNRFGGHSRVPLSVAQHSVIVSQFVPKEHALAGLLHDAAEAYLGDVPRPLKRETYFGRGYMVTEAVVWRAIAARFGVPEELDDSIKLADSRALATETRDLMGPPPQSWERLPEPLPVSVRVPMPWNIAEVAFIYRFKELTDGI